LLAQDGLYARLYHTQFSSQPTAASSQTKPTPDD
jgi:hypothetical protein